MEDGLFGESPPAFLPTVEAGSVRAAVSSPDAPPASFEDALHRFGDDRVFMLEMFKEFKDHLPARLAEIQEALRDGDANRLTRLAHNLKGVSLNFSADPLAEIGRQLEELGGRDDLSNAPALVQALESEIMRLIVFLTTSL